jgi:hypothetical protein
MLRLVVIVTSLRALREASLHRKRKRRTTKSEAGAVFRALLPRKHARTTRLVNFIVGVFGEGSEVVALSVRRLRDPSTQTRESLGIFIEPRFLGMNHRGREQDLAGVIQVDFEAQAAVLIGARFF